MRPRILTISSKESENVPKHDDSDISQVISDFAELNRKIYGCESDFDRQVNRMIKSSQLYNSSPSLQQNPLERDSTRISLALREVQPTQTNFRQAFNPDSRTRILQNKSKITSYGTTKAEGTGSSQTEEPSRNSPDFCSNYDIRFSSPNSESDPNKDPQEQKPVLVSDIIGNFGLFQFLVLIFSSIREASVGYDAVIMSTVLRPENEFYCAEDLILNSRESMATIIREINGTNQCFRHQVYDATGAQVPCNSWIFSHSSPGTSLVADWSLVCHRDWLVALTESAYFLGLMIGNLTWGYWADKVGRRSAYLVTHTIAVIAGLSSVLAPNIELLIVARFFCAFGSIGYNIIYSIQIELIGTKYRAFSTTLNHFGWGIGVICVPLANHLFSDYRVITSAAPVMALLMFPCAFWLPESPRWLMAHGQYARAKYELVRAAEYNGKKLSPALEKQITLMKQQVRQGEIKEDGLSIKENNKEKKSYALLFSSHRMVKDTVILAFASFSGHLFYYLLTINFNYMKNLSMDANFIMTGAGDWAAVIVGASMLRYLSRKTCMSIFLCIMALSFLLQALIESNQFPDLDTALIVTANNGIGTLSALLLIFIALIVNQEVYPTVIRQTGTSVVNTFGESGSTLAPVMIQASRLIGGWQMNVIYSIYCLILAFGMKFLTKTDELELS